LDKAMLIINDRVVICLAADADGVHLGQDDLSPESARRIFDQVKDGKTRIIGFSTHNLSQVIAADMLPIDYIAIGPVFVTGSKANPDPVIGLAGAKGYEKALSGDWRHHPAELFSGKSRRRGRGGRDF
jgi:thiamine-phosphate pyrophosphorylase